jgi:methionine synthase II (cobalamin-independent)
VTDQVYASRAEFAAEVAAITRAEIEALIAEGVRYVQLDNPGYGRFVGTHASSSDGLALSPQCGFASIAEGGNLMTEDEQFAKLRLVAETARAIWG